MAHSLDIEPHYRELAAQEQEVFFQHLLRLSPDSRYARFGYAVSDGFLETYSRSMPRLNVVTTGAFAAGTLRAAAELRRVSDICPRDGEIGLTVEDAWQDSGIGTELLSRVRETARHRGIETIHMICSRQNTRMRWLAQKLRARVEPLPDQVVGWKGEAGEAHGGAGHGGVGQGGAGQGGAGQGGSARHVAPSYSDFVTFSLDV